MITKRLHQYFKFKELSYYRVEKSLQVSSGSISGAVKNGRNVGSHVLEKILLVYDDLSAEWLMRGTGSMLKGPQDPEADASLSYQIMSNNWLIDKTISFFNLKSKHELISFFEKMNSKNSSDQEQDNLSPFEEKVIEIVQKKYGATMDNSEELYGMYLQQMMRDGENMIDEDEVKERKKGKG